jgi:type I restriction enzyme M protein
MRRSQTTRESDLQQASLFRASDHLPSALPLRAQLKPCGNLLAVFEDCHNYIYANEGLLKERIFHEIVKLLLMKLSDERGPLNGRVQFGITGAELNELQASQGGDFSERIRALFAAVKRDHPKLFAENVRLLLKPLTLAYVVGRLQSISLSQTPGDVKGKAFQAFVNRHQRGDRGEFFTPHPIVALAVAMIDPQPNEAVIDPCCGSAGFLVQAISHVARGAAQAASDWSQSRYVAERIRGIEFNPDIALAAMIRLAFEGGSGEEILCRNALLELGELAGAFDVVLTNPPFGAKGRVEDFAILGAYDLARKWTRDAHGTWLKSGVLLPGQTPDILFLEQCLRLLRPGGRMAVVLPDGLLQNVSSGHVRSWLRAHAEVLAVVSIPQEAFVPYGTGIKTSLVLLRKLPVPVRVPCFMARLCRLGYDVKGQPVFQRDSSGNVRCGPDGTPLLDQDLERIAQGFSALCRGQPQIESDDAFNLPAECLNSRLDVEHYLPSDRKLIAELVAGGAKPLGELAEICTEGDDFRLVGEDDIRYIAISDIDARTLQVVSQQMMKAHEAPSRATYRLRTGDIVTAVSGASTGTHRQATALITEAEDGAICSNGLAVLRNVRGVEPLYLLAYLRTRPFLRQVRRLMTGHAIPAISLEDLAAIEVPIPPLREQAEIAESVKQLLAVRREALRAGDALVNRLEALLSVDRP